MKRKRYVAECNRNRSQTWCIRDRVLDVKVQDYVINRDEARYAAIEWNLRDDANQEKVK